MRRLIFITGKSQAVVPLPVSPTYEMPEATVIFYRRLTYRDVLKRDRWSGFIYRWHIDGTHERLGGKYPEYINWK